MARIGMSGWVDGEQQDPRLTPRGTMVTVPVSQEDHGEQRREDRLRA